MEFLKKLKLLLEDELDEVSILILNRLKTEIQKDLSSINTIQKKPTKKIPSRSGRDLKTKSAIPISKSDLKNFINSKVVK